VVLIVLAVLGVAGDRVAARLVAGEAEKRLTAEGFTDPDVQVHGFPFVTQLAGREFARVTVTGQRLEVREGRARDVTAELRDVRVPSTRRVLIGSRSARATVPYDAVLAAVDSPSLTLAPGQNGQVRISRTVEAAGQTFDVVAQARVEADGTRLRLIPTDIAIAGGGSLGSELRSLLSNRVAISYPIPDLPEGVQVEEVIAVEDGFLVRAKGRGLTVQRG